MNRRLCRESLAPRSGTSPSANRQTADPYGHVVRLYRSSNSCIQEPAERSRGSILLKEPPPFLRSSRRHLVTLVTVLAASGIALPPIHAQETWTGGVEVSATTLTVEEGDAVSYRLRLTEPPTADGWWVRLHVDGVVRVVGRYGGISWVPSVGWEFNRDNWDRWREIRIRADEDADASDHSVTFTHEVWDHNADCPVHGASPVTIRVINAGGGETLPTLRIGDAAVSEGETAEFEVTLSALSEQPVTVDFATQSGTAGAGLDYTERSGTLTFMAGQTTKRIAVSTVEDDAPESEERFTVTLRNANRAVLGDRTGEGTITDDDDPAVTVSYRPTTYTVEEGDRQTVTVVLSADPEREVVIPITVVTGGTTATPSDYAGVPTTVTFTAGVTSRTFTFTSTEDTTDEADETVTLGFGTLPPGVTPGTDATAVVTIADATGTGTITDDDPAVTVSYRPTTYTVEEGDRQTVTVVLSADPEREVVIPITVVTGGTTATPSDYAGVPTTVTFTAGVTSRTFTFTSTEDTTDEADETVTLGFGTLPPGVTPGTDATAVVTIADATGTGTITDDDPAVTVSYRPTTYTVEEGDRQTVTVVLSADPEREVVIPITVVTGGTTATPSDYAGVPTTVTFTAGVTSRTFTFTSTEDTTDEADETVTLGFGTLPPGVTPGTDATAVVTIADATGTGTITDDDPAVTVSYRPTTYTVEEGDRQTVTVVLSADPEREVVIPITVVTGGTTATPSDYAGVPTTVTFTAGVTSRTFTFTSTEDTTDEADETVTLGFGTLPPGVTPGTDATAVVTIIDDDIAPVTVSYGAEAYTATEGGMGVEVTVRLSAPPGREVVVPLTETPGGGAMGDDYAGVPDSVTFGADETERTFTVTAVDDEANDDGETVTLGFGTLPPGVRVGDPPAAVVTLLDNDDDVHAPSSRAWLARFGRTTAGEVLGALGDRMTCVPDRRQDARSPHRDPRWRCEPPRQETLSVPMGGSGGAAPVQLFGLNRADHPQNDWRQDGWTLGEWRVTAAHNQPGRDMLYGSSFYLSSAEQVENGSPGWSLWGRGAFSRFAGRDGGATLGGDVATGTLGADYAGARWLAGLALSHSEGEGMFSLDGAGGGVTSSLTGLYPYLRYGVDERLSVWGVAGSGRGPLTLTGDGGETVETDIGMTMAAVGARGELFSPTAAKDFTLAFKTDVLFLRIDSDDVPGLLAPEAKVSVLRLGLEGSYDVMFDGGTWLAPFLEAGLRHDGGDAETGFGVELGGGLRYAPPAVALTAELSARGLLAHEVAGFAEWGVSGALRYDPAPSSEEGPSFTLSPAWGPASAGGADALWERENMVEIGANDSHRPGGRMEGELGYGFAALSARGVGTPYAGFSLGERGRDYRLGYRVGGGGSFMLELEGIRRAVADGSAEHGVILGAARRW